MKQLPYWFPREWVRNYRIVRALVPWRVLGWISDRYDVCWASLVGWKIGDAEGSLGSERCIEDGNEICYCGKYRREVTR